MTNKLLSLFERPTSTDEQIIVTMAQPDFDVNRLLKWTDKQHEFVKTTNWDSDTDDIDVAVELLLAGIGPMFSVEQ